MIKHKAKLKKIAELWIFFQTKTQKLTFPSDIKYKQMPGTSGPITYLFNFNDLCCQNQNSGHSLTQVLKILLKLFENEWSI